MMNHLVLTNIQIYALCHFICCKWKKSYYKRVIHRILQDYCALHFALYSQFMISSDICHYFVCIDFWCVILVFLFFIACFTRWFDPFTRWLDDSFTYYIPFSFFFPFNSFEHWYEFEYVMRPMTLFIPSRIIVIVSLFTFVIRISYVLIFSLYYLIQINTCKLVCMQHIELLNLYYMSVVVYTYIQSVELCYYNYKYQVKTKIWKLFVHHVK